MRIALLTALALLTAPSLALAQSAVPVPPSANLRALAAGYKALTLCSATVITRHAGGERSVESIERNELVGIYPELDPLIADLSAIEAPAAFSVQWDAAMPPRIARLSGTREGCVLLPIGEMDRASSLEYDAVDRQPQLDEIAWPAGNLGALVPADASADVAFLDATVRTALDEGYGERTKTTALVIVQNGRIIRERYADGFGIQTPQRTWSVAKSIAATIVGASVQRGEVDVSAPAAIPNWQFEGDPRRAITLDNLLHMASGLTSDSAGNRTDGIYFGGTTVDEQAPGWPLIAPPGSTFRYANNDTLLATLAIAPTFAAHPPRDFFASLSMHSTIAETDWRGNYILSSQVWATARDLARFGMLYLNDGVWNGTRLLPENWRAYVSTPSGPQPPGDFGYGASFWLLNRSEGVPADTFAAFGNRGQFVVIVPSRNIVIVRRGEDPHGARFDIAGFTRDVLVALE